MKYFEIVSFICPTQTKTIQLNPIQPKPHPNHYLCIVNVIYFVSPFFPRLLDFDSRFLFSFLSCIVCLSKV